MANPQPTTSAPPAIPFTQPISGLLPLKPPSPISSDATFPYAPYAHPLDDAQLKRRASILYRQAPYTIHPCTPYTDTGKKLPNIEFTIDELTIHLKAQLNAWNVLQDDPWLVGGAASNVMAGGEYSDVDLCFYLKKNDHIDELSLVLKSVRGFIRKKLKQLFPHEYHSPAFIDANYLFKKIRLDGFSYINLGNVDLKFILGKNHRLSVAASDGFHVPLDVTVGMVCCVDGSTLCDKGAFDQALANLISRNLSLKGAKQLHDIAWRLTHRTTQGYRIVSEERLSLAELSNIALRQIMAAYPGNDPMALERFQKKFFTHQDNHYPHNPVGMMSDFINLISFLQEGQAEPGDNLQPVRNGYIKLLANAWLSRRIPQDDPRKVPLLDPLVRLIAMDPSQTQDLLAVAKGLLLLEWINDPKRVKAYTFPFAENAHVPRLHVALPNELGFKSFVSLDGSPVETAKQFLRSWRKLEDHYAQKEEMVIFNKLGVGLGLSMPDLSQGLRREIVRYLSSAFLKAPVATTLQITYKNTPHEPLTSFYEFLRTEMGVEVDLINVHKHMHLGTLESCLQDIGTQNGDMAKLIHELKAYVNGMHAEPSLGNIQLIYKILSKLIQDKQQSLFALYPKLSTVLKDVILRICCHVSNPATPYSDAHPAAIRLFLLGVKLGIVKNAAECTVPVTQLLCGSQPKALETAPHYLVEMYNLIQSSAAWTKDSDICQQQIRKLYPVMSACALATAEKLVKAMNKEEDAQLASFCLQMAHSIPNAFKNIQGLAIASSQFLQHALAQSSDVQLFRASHIALNLISMKAKLEEDQYRLILIAGEKLLDQFQAEKNPKVAEKFLSRGLDLLVGVANSNMQPEWQKHCRTLILTHIRVCLHSKRPASEIEQIYSACVGKILLLNQIKVKFPNECEILQGLTKADFEQFMPLIIRDFNSAANAMGLASQVTAQDKSAKPAESKQQTIMQLLYALGCKHADFNQLVNLMGTSDLSLPPNIKLISDLTAHFNRVAANKPKSEITAHPLISQFVNTHLTDIVAHATTCSKPTPELILTIQKLAMAAAASGVIDHATQISAATAIFAAFDKKLLEISPAYLVECYDFLAKVDKWNKKPGGLSELRHFFYKIAAEKNLASQLAVELSAVMNREGQIDVTVPAKSLQFMVDLANATADKILQKKIQSKLLEALSSCLAAQRPNMLQPLFSECAKKFAQLKSVAAGWPDQCRIIADLANTDLCKNISPTLQKFVIAAASIDLEYILSFVETNKIKRKMEAADYAAMQKILQSHQLSAKIRKLLQIVDQGTLKENTDRGSDIAHFRIAASIQEICESDIQTCQLIEALYEYLTQARSPPDAAALHNVSTTLQKIDKESALPAVLNNPHLSERLNGLFFGIIMNALKDAAPSTELLIIIQEITGFCVENGILKNPYASKAIERLFSLTKAARMKQSAALVASSDAFLKSIQRYEDAGKELHSQIGNIRSQMYQQALPAVHAILHHIVTESDEALAAKCLILSLKAPHNETQDQSFQEAFTVFAQHVLKSKHGFGLRTAYEVAISALNRKTKLEPTQVELMRQIGLALIALPSQKWEKRQSHKLYLDIGLSLLTELTNSTADIKMQQQVRTLILQGMFDCLMAVISRQKKQSIYGSYFRALEQMPSAQDICKNFPLPSEDDGTNSLSPFYKRFISAMFVADTTLAASFVAHPQLKSRMRTADYDDVQRIAFKAQSLDGTQPALVKRFKAWELLPQAAPAALDPWIEQINGSFELLNLMAGLHPKQMKNNIVTIAEYVIKKLKAIQQESDEWKKKAAEKIADPLLYTHWNLHKVEAPKLAERLNSAARAGGLLSEQDIKNSLIFVIERSTAQIPTLHLMQQFLTEFLEQPLMTHLDRVDFVSRILIQKALQSKETALHKAAFAIFQKTLQRCPKTSWPIITEALLVSFMNHRSASDAEEREFNKILIELLALMKTEHGISIPGWSAFIQATIDSGRLLTCAEINTAIRSLETETLLLFTTHILAHAAKSSDPKLFEWIKHSIAIGGILMIYEVPLEEAATSFLLLFRHVENVCTGKSPNDVIPCAEFLVQQWHQAVAKLPTSGNEWQLKAIHEILFKICLQSNSHDHIAYACYSYYDAQAEFNIGQIWENLGKALIQLELQNPKTPQIEKDPLNILERIFERTFVLKTPVLEKCAMGAYVGLLHYFETTKFEDLLQTHKDPEALVVRILKLIPVPCELTLLSIDGRTTFSNLLQTIKSFLGVHLTSEHLKQFSKDIISQQKTIASVLSQTDPQNLTNHFQRFNQFLDAGFDAINPESMREFLIAIFQRTTKCPQSWYKEMKAILRSGNLYPMEKLLKKDRTGPLGKIALERILAEEYCIHSMCESKGLEQEAIERFGLLINLVDVNRPAELASLLKAGVDVFDYLFLPLFRNPADETARKILYHFFELLAKRVFTGNISPKVSVSLRQFAARILGRIMTFETAIMGLYIAIKDSLVKQGKKNPQVVEFCKGKRISFDSEFTKRLQKTALDKNGLTEFNIGDMFRLLSKLENDDAIGVDSNKDLMWGAVMAFSNFLERITFSDIFKEEGLLTKASPYSLKDCLIIPTIFEAVKFLNRSYPDPFKQLFFQRINSMIKISRPVLQDIYKQLFKENAPQPNPPASDAKQQAQRLRALQASSGRLPPPAVTSGRRTGSA